MLNLTFGVFLTLFQFQLDLLFARQWYMLRKGKTSRPIINAMFGLTPQIHTTFPKRTVSATLRFSTAIIIVGCVRSKSADRIALLDLTFFSGDLHSLPARHCPQGYHKTLLARAHQDFARKGVAQCAI